MPEEEQQKDAVRMGKSKSGATDMVFLRDWLGQGIDELRLEAFQASAVTIQSFYRAKVNTRHACVGTTFQVARAAVGGINRELR